MTEHDLPAGPLRVCKRHRSRSVPRALFGLALASILAFGARPVQAAPPMLTEAEAVALVSPLYQALTAASPAEIEPSVVQTTAPDWQNCTGDDACQDRAATIRRWTGRITLIPDYRLDRKDILVSGDRIVVRGEATGTPATNFLGVQPTGKSFRIMTMDIHDVKDGKIVRTFHVEDWATAIRQLTAK